MILEQVKTFSFSASHASEGKIWGRNYELEISTPALSQGESERVDRLMAELIKKLDSKDLGLHVDFLSGVQITDPSFATALFNHVRELIQPTPLLGLSLNTNRKNRISICV